MRKLLILRNIREERMNPQQTESKNTQESTVRETIDKMPIWDL